MQRHDVGHIGYVSLFDRPWNLILIFHFSPIPYAFKQIIRLDKLDCNRVSKFHNSLPVHNTHSTILQSPQYTPQPRRRRPPSILTSSQRHFLLLHPLLLLLPLIQVPNLCIRRSPIQYLVAIDESLPATRVATFSNFSATVIVGSRDVEAVDVAGNYAGYEEEGIDYAVGAGSC